MGWFSALQRHIDAKLVQPDNGEFRIYQDALNQRTLKHGPMGALLAGRVSEAEYSGLRERMVVPLRKLPVDQKNTAVLVGGICGIITFAILMALGLIYVGLPLFFLRRAASRRIRRRTGERPRPSQVI